MTDSELRDKLKEPFDFYQSEWWKDATRKLCADGWPHFVVALNCMVRDANAAYMHVCSERDQLRAEVEQIKKDNAWYERQVALATNKIVRERDQLKAQCEKLAEALGRASGYMDSLAFYTGEMADKYLQEKSADIKQVLAEYRKSQK